MRHKVVVRLEVLLGVLPMDSLKLAINACPAELSGQTLHNILDPWVWKGCARCAILNCASTARVKVRRSEA
jgi:hypothetical protein